ncbi:hypothetical protein [Halorubrum sp. SD690R]|uniref:hypothetical protein n=1 Tax=Halorubrum sp. SD690R TaxID=2518117 RepID=UPI001F547023|nr:hypothetical protein [Halorubrum sp. SD690R]
MSEEVELSDWAHLDPWWSASTQTNPAGQDPDVLRVLDKEWMTDLWDEVDSWWEAYTDISPFVRGEASGRVLSIEQQTDLWDELDPWWDIYTEVGHNKAKQIAELLDKSNNEWAQSPGPFDTDPLAADLSGRQVSRGPVQPNGEVEWSRWLAQLLRPSAALVTELFGVVVSKAPSGVVREEQLSKEGGTFRRPDILVLHSKRGISIEVKLGDENYRKTSETAALVERHYADRQWTHTLLLPSRKQERLAATVEPPLDRKSGDRLMIEWDDPGSIGVLYWRDVTAAIRSILRRGEVVDDHWAANAYLFCAVAEQQIMGFYPQPVVEQLTGSADVVNTLRPTMLADTLDKQLTYLREREET